MPRSLLTLAGHATGTADPILSHAAALLPGPDGSIYALSAEGLSRWRLDAAGAAQRAEAPRDAPDPVAGAAPALALVELGGRSVLLATGGAAPLALATGPGGTLGAALPAGRLPGTAGDLVAGPGGTLYGIDAAAPGVRIWAQDGDGRPGAPRAVDGALQAGEASGLALARDGAILLAAGRGEEALTSYRVGADGSLALADRVRVSDGYGVSGPRRWSWPRPGAGTTPWSRGRARAA